MPTACPAAPAGQDFSAAKPKSHGYPMSVLMKGLRSFHGAGEGKVRRGREFKVRDIQRANELEAHGLAYRVETKAEPGAPLNKMESPPPNKAAEQGPFDSAGGKTGEDAPAPSSPPAPARRRRRSSSSAGDLLS